MNPTALCATVFLISMTAWGDILPKPMAAPSSIPSSGPSATHGPSSEKIPGVPLPLPSGKASADPDEGGSAEDLLNSKDSQARPCKDANGITVYPSDPNYKAKCSARGRGAGHPRLRIPIPGDT